MKNISKITAAVLLLSSCTVGGLVSDWYVINTYDEFTEDKSCIVEYGNPLRRSFAKGFIGQYFTYQFYAENKNGEIRAGIKSEPAIAISGDVQIKIGKKLITMTSKDTPLNSTPKTYDIPSFEMPKMAGNPAYNQAMEQAMKASKKMTKDLTKNVYKMTAPYRAYSGKKAKKFLKEIINYGGEIKFRTVGVHSTTSGTGKFTADKQFEAALKKCEINL